MGNKITFRVESDEAGENFWYTLVSGNGNTTMRSTKTDYFDHENAKRAARRQAAALLQDEIVVEYTDAEGNTVVEKKANKGRTYVAVPVRAKCVHPRDL